jgi:hypothetical protein
MTVPNNWPSNNGKPNRIAAGHHIFAVNDDEQNVRVPVSFVTRLHIAGTNNSLKPWHTSVLSSPLNSGSSVFSESPFVIRDGGLNSDFTALVVTAN